MVKKLKADKNENEIQIPAMIKEQGLEAERIWLEREKLLIKANNCPERTLLITNENDEDTIIDCKMPAGLIRKAIDKHCTPVSSRESKAYREEMKEEAVRRRVYIQKTYFNKMNSLKKKLNAVTKVEGENGILNLKELEVIELAGKFFTVDEILKVIKEDWSYNMPKVNLVRFLNERKKVIDEKKAEYVLKNKDFRISHETGRAECLNELLSVYQRDFQKKKSDNTARLILQILEQGRKEFKGNDLHLTVDGKIDINATIQASENIVEVSKKLPINMLIIGIVAAKAGINPEFIQTALATSYYSKFNGFNGAISDEEIQSPSNLIQNYNWDDLKQKHESLPKKSEQKIEDALILKTEEEMLSARESKKSLLDSLKKIGKDLK